MSDKKNRPPIIEEDAPANHSGTPSAIGMYDPVMGRTERRAGGLRDNSNKTGIRFEREFKGREHLEFIKGVIRGILSKRKK